MGGDARQLKKRVVSAQDALRYAMSLPVSTTISGIDSLKILRQNLKVARGFKPMSHQQMDTIRKRMRAHATDGRYELYKTTAAHEEPEGRKQHKFPGDEEVAA